QLSEQEATITQNPLLQVAEGMFDDGSAPDHHLWMRLHPLMHTFERGFMDMPTHVSTFSLGIARTSGLERLGLAETQSLQIQTSDIGLDHPYQMILRYQLLQCGRKQAALLT